MLSLGLLLILALAAAGFVLGRARLARVIGGGGPRPVSRPIHHGLRVALWSAVPAAAVALAAALVSGPVQVQAARASLPAEIAAQAPLEQSVYVSDVIAQAHGGFASARIRTPAEQSAMTEAAQTVRRIDQGFRWGGLALALIAGFLAGWRAIVSIRPELKARQHVEAWIWLALALCSTVAVLTTVGIIGSLLYESLRFFRSVSPVEFLTGLQWSPQIAIRADQAGQSGAFGAVPLFAGTLLITVIAMVVAAPIGLYAAIYLAEYASRLQRAWIKPMLEILAGVPTVVYGFFAALTVGPALRGFFNGIGAMLAGGPLDALGQHLMQVQNQMALVAGAVMGIMLIPFVSSLSDDILNATPQSLRDGSLALGATRSETVRKVLLPAALPGIAAALLLAVSRAIGETMIVTMAAGLQANLTANPLDTVTTVTVQIVTLLTGDQEFNSPKTLAAFGLGLTLFAVTLALNLIAQRIVKAYREQYD
ncbi:phosphate ABC transporter permease subunit PstC [Brevundimonas sp. 2R-24]|uniref:Phosphate transport system permease protein n=1 Tax=Peiella sedimenti TaxID=3061083 RepID=A0ABT8SLR5_9CAUL|nr:phosphate ABC transporter permease subunit PstC [Caulobacteraceae bacterium XZ-24]